MIFSNINAYGLFIEYEPNKRYIICSWNSESNATEHLFSFQPDQPNKGVTCPIVYYVNDICGKKTAGIRDSGRKTDVFVMNVVAWVIVGQYL